MGQERTGSGAVETAHCISGLPFPLARTRVTHEQHWLQLWTNTHKCKYTHVTGKHSSFSFHDASPGREWGRGGRGSRSILNYVKEQLLWTSSTRKSKWIFAFGVLYGKNIRRCSMFIFVFCKNSWHPVTDLFIKQRASDSGHKDILLYYRLIFTFNNNL